MHNGSAPRKRRDTQKELNRKRGVDQTREPRGGNHGVQHMHDESTMRVVDAETRHNHVFLSCGGRLDTHLRRSAARVKEDCTAAVENLDMRRCDIGTPSGETGTAVRLS